MSYPVLYDPKETDFYRNGRGILSSCLSCKVTEETSGIFELSLQYPIDGIHFEKIFIDSIIKAKVDQVRDPQLFRVYFIGKPMSKIATIHARHISYDLSTIPISPVSYESNEPGIVAKYNATDLFNAIKNNSAVENRFSFFTDIETIISGSRYGSLMPLPFKEWLVGRNPGSMVRIFGGVFEFDNFTIKLLKSRGQNKGFSIKYGKNLTDIKQEENFSNVITGIYPFWYDSKTHTYVELPEKIVYAEGNFNQQKIKIVDLSGSFENAPDEHSLRSQANFYMQVNNIGKPVVSLTVSFVQLGQFEEYKNIESIEKISLYDTVNVEFPAMGVSADAIVSKTVYDSLQEKVVSVVLGSPILNIADTIAEQQKQIEDLKGSV